MSVEKCKPVALSILLFSLITVPKNYFDLFLFSLSFYFVLKNRSIFWIPILISYSFYTFLPPFLPEETSRLISLGLLTRSLGFKIIKKNIVTLSIIGLVFHFFSGIDFKTVLFLPLTYSFFVHSKYINLIAISLAIVLDYILGFIGFLLLIFKWLRKFRFALFFSVVSLFTLSQSLFELNKNLSQLFANFSFFTPLIFIFFRQSYFAQLCAFFSYVALPHMMLFSKLSSLKETNSKAIVAILLVQTLISSQNLPRVSTLNDGSRKIIFGVECGKLIKNHSDLCKRFKSLWDKDKRLCFNNEPFDEIKECRGRKYITLRGIAN